MVPSLNAPHAFDAPIHSAAIAGAHDDTASTSVAGSSAEPTASASADSNSTVPKRLWLFWDVDPPPELVDATLARCHRLHPGWDMQILHAGHDLVLSGLLPPPPIDGLEAEHLSDWYRINVIAQFGGVWMDATAIPIKPVTSWVDMQSTAQLQGFATPEGGSGWVIPDATNPQVENWAFAAPAGSPLVARWLRNYRNALLLGADEYMALPSTRSVLLGAPLEKYGGTYLLQHAAYSQTRSEMPHAPILVRRSDVEGAPFSLHVACGWESTCVLDRLFGPSGDLHQVPEAYENTSFIKLCGFDRPNVRPLAWYATVGHSWLATTLLDEMPSGLERAEAPQKCPVLPWMDNCNLWLAFGLIGAVATLAVFSYWLYLLIDRCCACCWRVLCCCCSEREGQGGAAATSTGGGSDLSKRLVP